MPEILYANIALDIEAKELRDRLFAYQIPDHLGSLVFIGSQVLVPFGKQHSVGGYVVSISDKRPTEVNRMRSISEVVEAVPLFDDEYIDFLHWLAFTSCASLADVIAAALPSFLAPRLKRKVRLTEKGLNKIGNSLTNPHKILNLLATKLNQKNKHSKVEIAYSSLKRGYMRQFGLSQQNFYKELTFLKQEELVEIVTDTSNSVKPKTVLHVQVGNNPAVQQRHKEIVQLVKINNGSMSLKDLLVGAKTTRATIKKLTELGLLIIQEIEVVRNPLPGLTLDSVGGVKKEISLTNDQKSCLAILERELESTINSGSNNPDNKKPWLLHGVTGSGKTEVYLRLIDKALQQNKSALLLVPEISLTPQLATLLVDRFKDQVAVWHSAISPGERLDTWKRLREGQARVLLGARSAILANIKNLGLIILDEEHDTSYKQTSPSPRYNAKSVALEKARRTGSLLLLGSATPDLVSYYKAKNDNRILELPKRVHEQKLPAVEVVDMRQELANGNRTIFSNQLQKSIVERLEKKEQVILLINRRGYANHVFCRACGFIAKCQNCSVTLTFHRHSNAIKNKNPVMLSATSQNSNPTIESSSSSSSNTLRGFLSCHHCGVNKGFTSICPECKSPFLKEYGLGTQKVEETIHEHFPQASTVRLDSDVTTKKGEFKRILDIFNKGEADILIGTQMVAKGLDVHNVTLVGVLAADAALNMPDYRSTERGFQLLAQVAGRAGRGFAPGQVIFQTYNPELEIFKWAKVHDYHNFYAKELTNRQEFLYPPFSRIVRIIVTGADLEIVEEECDLLAAEILNFSNDDESDISLENFQILGPAPCIIERLRGSYRYHILLKIVDQDDLLEGLLGFLRMRKSKQNVRTLVDVDALDLL